MTNHYINNNVTIIKQTSLENCRSKKIYHAPIQKASKDYGIMSDNSTAKIFFSAEDMKLTKNRAI